MRILLDQNCPKRLGPELIGHEAIPAASMGWAELSNGELLAAAETAGFDILLTADRNLRYQQNLSDRRIALVVLSLNKLVALLDHVDRVRAAVGRATQGSYEEVEIPPQALRRRPWPRIGS